MNRPEEQIQRSVFQHIRARAENEVWRDIDGWEQYYQISNTGRVRRIATSNSTYSGRILKPLVGGRGSYHLIQLCRDGRCVTKKISRLVAAAFLPDFSDELQVDHIDGDTSNNSCANLRCVRPTDNAKNKGRYKTSKFNSKGVTFRRGRFEARICVDGKRISLGTFVDLASADAAYRNAATKYFGEFARALS